jgi:vacuolar-type H+-ATPase subunit E/Vma4
MSALAGALLALWALATPGTWAEDAPQPALHIDFTVQPAMVVAPGDISMTFLIENRSNRPVQNIYLTSADGLLSEPIGQLGAGESQTLVRPHAVTQEELDDGQVVYTISHDPQEADGEKAAADYAARAAETVRQVERDTVRKIGDSVTALLEKLLAKDVDRALADEKTVVSLVAEAVKGLVGPAEVAVDPKLAAALKAQLAAQSNITVVTDERLGTGFSVKTEGGRVEHAFTGDAIASELARRLRPDLAKLLK